MEVGDRAAERQTKRGCIVLERMEKRQRGNTAAFSDNQKSLGII